VTQLKLEPATQQGRRRRKAHVIRYIGVVLCAMLVICVAVLFAVKLSSPSRTSGSAQTPIRYLGVFEPGSPDSYAGVENFAQVAGRKPNLVVYYSVWNEKFQEAFAEDVVSHGATPIIQIEPFSVSLAKIAAGTYNSYLSTFADDVAAFGHKVIISFGHEMNGYWYSWGYRHTSPADFIAAWRHVVTLFRQHGANNVTWLWQVNSLSSQISPPGEWWPGSQYVSWVGISGYYYLPGDSFAGIFDPVFVDIRQFTQDPVLIAETAVGPQAGQSRGIKDLFAGVRAQGDIGFVWFDQHSYGGIYKGEDWRLEDSPSAMKVFRTALKGTNGHK
jgi:mannan endo-1,4-beta-mannosidase